MHVHGDAAAIVHHGNGFVRMHGDVDFIGKAGHRFIDRIVHHFPNEMVQTHLSGRADVHRRAQAHGLQAAENLDRFRVVFVAAWRRAANVFLFARVFFVAHVFSWLSNFSRVLLPSDKLRTIRSAGPRSKLFFCEARKACLRIDPYVASPCDSGSPGESRTRRVPAPSHLAQRDVAKTHVSPGEGPQASGAKPDFWVTFTWRTCR